MQSSIEIVSTKFASYVRDSILIMKSKTSGASSPKEATSGQGPTSESGMSRRIEHAGTALAQELSARTATAAVAGGHPGFGLVAPVLQRICRRLAKYGICRALGQGASGTVVLADDLKNGGKVAIKVMKRPKPGSNNTQHNLANELTILRHLSSRPFGRTLVTEFKESFVDAYNYYFVMNYCPGGHLYSVMKEYKGILPLALARYFTAELLTGVFFLHANGIIHRDIKPENLLISSEGHIVISDFGLAHATVNGPPTAYAGTPGYLAPEMFTHKSYMYEVDMWSVGCVVYEMLFGCTPFNPRDPKETVYNPVTFPSFRPIKPEFAHFIYMLLEKDQAHRLSAAEAVDHPCFKDIDMVRIMNRKYAPPSELRMPEEHSTGEYIPAEFLGDAELAFYDWPTQSPLDIIFFSGPLELGDIPSPPVCYEQVAGACRVSSSPPPQLPTIKVSEAPAPLAKDAAAPGLTSGETMVSPVSTPVSPATTVAGGSSLQVPLCGKAKWSPCLEVL